MNRKQKRALHHEIVTMSYMQAMAAKQYQHQLDFPDQIRLRFYRSWTQYLDLMLCIRDYKNIQHSPMFNIYAAQVKRLKRNLKTCADCMRYDLRLTSTAYDYTQYRGALITIR